MRSESITKKISCTVVKTSLLYGAGDLSVSKPWDEHFHTKPVTQINPPKRALDMAGVLSGFAPKSWLLDYYA
jgi:hypothetical protein